MKATCIIGSPHLDGSTVRLAESLLSGLRDSGVQTVRYCVGQCRIHYCLGCKVCYETGRCVQSDDVEGIVTDLITSDLAIIAAPSWWADVPGQLKVLFDRTTPYGDTNPNRILQSKKPIRGIAIAVRAGVRESENELLLNAIDHYFGHLGIEPFRRFSVTRTDSPEDLIRLHGDTLASLYALGKTLGQGSTK